VARCNRGCAGFGCAGRIGAGLGADGRVISYDERSKPAIRKAVKEAKWKEQNGLCAECGLDLPLAYSELDRREAAGSYTLQNTELVHPKCHHAREAVKGYA